MQTSNRGIEEIKRHEGLRLKAYQDVVGYWTIGYGHLIKMPKEKGLLDYEITQDFADKLLREDLQEVEYFLNRNVLVNLTQSQYDALADFTFNLGISALNRSTLLRLLNAGEYSRASDQLLLWDKAGGKPVAGLTKRRQDNKRLFDENT